MMRRSGLLCLVLLSAGCSDAGLPDCAPGARQTIVAELIFGRNVGHELGVSEADWDAFLSDEVTPRFPNGLTVLDGWGQWRPDGGGLVREPSKALLIALREKEGEQAGLAAIADAYKRRFRQQSVVTILRPACVSF